MSNFEQFMKKNKVKVENVKYPVTASLQDENGEPLLWELRAVPTKERHVLTDECTYVKQTESGEVTELDNNLLMRKVAAAAVVYPNLRDKELQDSYGVMTPEDLIVEMVDCAEEFTALMVMVNKYGKVDIKKEIDEAKN